MSAQKSRFGGYAGSTTSSKRKVSVTYTLREKREPLNRSGVNQIRVDSDNKKIYTAGRDSIIRCWDLSELSSSNGQCDCELSMEHHTDWVNDIVLCKNGSTLMSASSDTSLKVWDLSRGTCTSTLKPHKDYVQALAYSPHTETVVSAGLDHELYLWDINALTSLTATRNTVTTIPLRGQKESIYSVDINKQGTLVVSGSTEKALKLWDTRSYQKLMKLKGHTDNVRSVLLNEDGSECLSASSDGTVRLWSISQQRCMETFRIHEGGVWVLVVDESFKYFYSSGKDKKVYLTDMTEGGQESVLLFTEEYPVLSIALDATETPDCLWIGTTATRIQKWPALPNEIMNGEAESDMELDPGVTDIDDISHTYTKPLLTIPGGNTIVECKILSNKRQVLTKDNTDNVELWDILHAIKESDLGKVDMDMESNQRTEPLFVPNWFSCDIKTGMLSVRLEENDAFSAWVMGNNTNLPNTSDLKLNYGALMLKALFEHWPESHAAKQEQKLLEQKKIKTEGCVTQELFESIAECIEELDEFGKALGLSDETLQSLNKEGISNFYKLMYKEDNLSVGSLQNTLTSLNRQDLVSKLDNLINNTPESNNKVDAIFFSVPPHTPVILSEATDCGPTLVRFLCSEASNSHEKNLLKTYCPLWVSDIVVQNELPQHPKMSFTLGKLQETSQAKEKIDRLSAQDILTIAKVLDYLYNKLYGEKEPKPDPSEYLQIYCQGQVLEPLLDIRTVKHTIWKSGGDMKLQYQVIEKSPKAENTTSSEDVPSNE